MPEVEAELKNNDIGFGIGDSECVQAVHYWVREFDGGYSFYIGLENGLNQEYLYSDPNRYKDDIERMALERTGRTLKLQGELKLAFFPSLGAAVAGVTLSERGSGREFVSLESVHASIKLMPLLRGQAVVDAVRVSGLKAQVVKNKDGTYNFSDLLEGGEAKPAAKPAPEKKGEHVIVDADYVRKMLTDIVKDQDLSRYIL